MSSDRVEELADGDGGQQTPQVTAILSTVVTGSDMAKEAAKGRLHDVFRVRPSRKLWRETLASQVDQSVDIAIEQLGSRPLIAGASPRQQVARLARIHDRILA